MATNTEIEAFINKIDAITDMKDDTLFQGIVSQGMTLLGLENAVLAERFGISRSTITRWRQGTTVPHPAMRPTVYKLFKTYANDFLQTQ